MGMGVQIAVACTTFERGHERVREVVWIPVECTTFDEDRRRKVVCIMVACTAYERGVAVGLLNATPM